MCIFLSKNPQNTENHCNSATVYAKDTEPSPTHIPDLPYIAFRVWLFAHIIRLQYKLKCRRTPFCTSTFGWSIQSCINPREKTLCHCAILCNKHFQKSHKTMARNCSISSISLPEHMLFETILMCNFLLLAFDIKLNPDKYRRRTKYLTSQKLWKGC